jgi:hypothetical protein
MSHYPRVAGQAGITPEMRVAESEQDAGPLQHPRDLGIAHDRMRIAGITGIPRDIREGTRRLAVGGGP